MRSWLITGGSKGLGRAFAEVALEHGDRVAVTARDKKSVDDLAEAHPGTVIAIGLDVTDRSAVIDAADAVVSEWGAIDVLVNNAGYGLAGGVEEVSEDQARAQIEVNFFGALWCTQAVLPSMRRQKSGHIFQISSIGGIAALPNAGLYCASKFALEGLSESLAAEVKSFGINVTLVELGPFRTDWNGDSMDRAEPNPDYDEILAERRALLSGAYARTQPGDPHKAGAALVELLDAETPPLRLLMGAYAADRGPTAMAARLEEWEAWDSLARGADFADGE
jgi:NAD(P)-dependent dehydrogenase (short-subunit alcohol dehydrogenase family)